MVPDIIQMGHRGRTRWALEQLHRITGGNVSFLHHPQVHSAIASIADTLEHVIPARTPCRSCNRAREAARPAPPLRRFDRRRRHTPPLPPAASEKRPFHTALVLLGNTLPYVNESNF